jgi:hypothetical protein
MLRYHPGVALIVVDVQNDFADPAGSLSVRGGADIIPIVNREATGLDSLASVVVLGSAGESMRRIVAQAGLGAGGVGYDA